MAPVYRGIHACPGGPRRGKASPVGGATLDERAPVCSESLFLLGRSQGTSKDRIRACEHGVIPSAESIANRREKTADKGVWSSSRRLDILSSVRIALSTLSQPAPLRPQTERQASTNSKGRALGIAGCSPARRSVSSRSHPWRPLDV